MASIPPWPKEFPAASTSEPAVRAAPTVRQVYALAGALCERLGEEWPATRAEASELIERLRSENGHPQPRLADCPPQRRRRRRPYPWWEHLRPKEVQIVVIGPDPAALELAQAARERLRARLAQEAETLVLEDADSAVIGDVQAFLEKLAPEVNTA
jgi:hypothetical protein